MSPISEDLKKKIDRSMLIDDIIHIALGYINALVIVFLIIGLFILVLAFVGNYDEKRTEKRSQSCQRAFGKDYIYQRGATRYESGYCVGNEGIRKYLKDE